MPVGIGFSKNHADQATHGESPELAALEAMQQLVGIRILAIANANRERISQSSPLFIIIQKAITFFIAERPATGEVTQLAGIAQATSEIDETITALVADAPQSGITTDWVFRALSSLIGPEYVDAARNRTSRAAG